MKYLEYQVFQVLKQLHFSAGSASEPEMKCPQLINTAHFEERMLNTSY
jgi:hypothetical protein